MNAGATSFRSRTCSGPSISDMVRRYGRHSSGTSRGRMAKLSAFTAKRGSVSIARASSWRSTAHIGARPGTTSRASGERSRTRP